MQSSGRAVQALQRAGSAREQENGAGKLPAGTASHRARIHWAYTAPESAIAGPAGGYPKSTKETPMPYIEAHTLEHDFPEHLDIIKQLYEDDLEFKLQSDRYHQLDKKIRGLEAAGVTTDDQHYNNLKRLRVQLKDQLYQQIIDFSPAAEPG